MNSDAVRDLAQVLKRERAALCCGDLHELTAIVASKQALLEQIEGPADTPALEELRRQAQRNQALLEAALRGIRAALSRIAEIRQSVRQCDTYTPGGQIRTLRIGGGSTERRA